MASELRVVTPAPQAIGKAHMKDKTIASGDSPVHTKSQERTSGSTRRCAGMRADSITRAAAGVFLTLALSLLCVPTLAALAEDESHRVLVLHSFRNSLPVNTDWYNGIVRGFSSASDLRIEIDIEAPDLTRFDDTDYVSNLFDTYRHTYRDQKPDLIIPTYTPALKFMLEHGEELFPGIPIVFCGADDQFVASQKLAADITGVTTHRDIAGTLQLALQVHPGAATVRSGRLIKIMP
jgi:ABC-type uncharacterized transport system substrate-binding protein